jgi:hypothetical protein
MALIVTGLAYINGRPLRRIARCQGQVGTAA